MNSSFDTIAGSRPWRPSRHCLASEPAADRRITSRYAARRTFPDQTTIHWGVLKQPDKQKITSFWRVVYDTVATLFCDPEEFRASALVYLHREHGRRAGHAPEKLKVGVYALGWVTSPRRRNR